MPFAVDSAACRIRRHSALPRAWAARFALVFALVAPLTATATDSDGTVARVEFFNGTTRLGGDTTAPYSIQWNVGAAGAYTITARATDNAGATGTSGPVAVTVVEKR
jgi:Bacterial Ig domain